MILSPQQTFNKKKEVRQKSGSLSSNTNHPINTNEFINSDDYLIELEQYGIGIYTWLSVQRLGREKGWFWSIAFIEFSYLELTQRLRSKVFRKHADLVQYLAVAIRKKHTVLQPKDLNIQRDTLNRIRYRIPGRPRIKHLRTKAITLLNNHKLRFYSQKQFENYLLACFKDHLEQQGGSHEA